jgi:hypothetical protein
LASFAFAFITTNYYANRSIKILLSLNFVAKSLAASMVMSFLLIMLRPEGTLELALSIVSGALVYFAVLFFLKGFTISEIGFVRKLLFNR